MFIVFAQPEVADSGNLVKERKKEKKNPSMNSRRGFGGVTSPKPETWETPF